MLFKNYIKNKSILIVGNGESVLNQKRNLSDYNVIVRINDAPILADYTDTRTNIWATSLLLPKINVKMLFGKPKFKIWLTPEKRNLVKAYYGNEAIMYPLYRWQKLQETLNSRPSSGAMIIDYIYSFNNYKKLALVGFDWWETKSWHRKELYKGPHNAENEKNWVNTLNLELLQ